MRPLLTGCLLVCLVLLGAPGPVSAAPRVKLYKVQRGDTCWNIAERHFGDPKKYDVIHRLNRLGPLPHILKPGSMLRLPGNSRGPDATVDWLKRDVKTKAPKSPDWKRARVKMGLWQLYKVSTGDNSQAGIRFEDDSFLQLRQSALLIIYGGSQKKSKSRKLYKREIVVEKGIVRGGLKSLYKDAKLTVRTPSSTVVLKSKLSQVEVDKKKSSIVSVYQGKANVKNKQGEVNIPEDHGTVVEKGKKPQKPRRLPPPPRWQTGQLRLLIPVPRGHKGAIEARWQKVKRAQRYRVELARNRRFRSPMVDAVVGAGILRFRAKELKPGRYFARLATIDRSRLESRSSKVLVIDVVALQTSKKLELLPDGTYRCAGLLKITPPTGSTLQIKPGTGPFEPFSAPLRLQRPALHTLGFRASPGAPVVSIKLRLIPYKARIDMPPKALDPTKAHSLSIRVTDSLNRPARPLGLRLTSWPGGVLKLSYLSPGRYRTMLRPTAKRLSEIVVRVSWDGGDLTTARIKLKTGAPSPTPTPGKPKPTDFRWQLSPLSVEWGFPIPGLPTTSARPQTFVGLSTFVTSVQRSGQSREIPVRFAFHGELALDRNRLGLELSLPWLVVDAKHDSANGNRFGDLRFGVRYLALDRAGTSLAPTLRLVAPTGGEGFPNIFWFEPGVLLEWRYAEQLLLYTSQIAAIGVADSGTRFTYSGTLGTLYQPLSWLAFGAELGWSLGFAGPDNDQRALMLAGLLRFQFGRVRISLSCGGGLNSDARERFGDFSAGLTVELGFRGL